MRKTVIKFNLEQTELHSFGEGFGLFKICTFRIAFLSSGTGMVSRGNGLRCPTRKRQTCNTVYCWESLGGLGSCAL